MRRLAYAAGGFSAAIFLAFYIFPVRLLPWLALLFAAAAVAMGLMRRKWLRAFVICFAGFAFGCLYFCGAYLAKALPAQRLDGVTAELEGTVLTYPADCGEYCRYEVRAALPTGGKTRAVVYDRSSATPADMAPGWRIKLTAQCRAADTRYGEDYDYYNSNGIFLVAGVKSAPETLSCRRSILLSLGQDISRAVCRSIDGIFPADTAAFMKSLLIGSRSELYKDNGAYMAMSRAGITHIVAISGMHVAFLISLMQLFLGASRQSSLICISAVWIFVAASGGSPSAVRAGVMQSLLLLAPVFSRENDPPTALMAALGVLLLANPYSAASVSLQLSFGAVAGLLLFSAPLARAILVGSAGRLRSAAARNAANVTASSLAVMVFTVPLTALHFGYVAILSPIANVLCLWAVSICFCGGYLACIAGVLFAPAGMLLAKAVSWLVRYIVFIAKLISSVPFAAIYMNDAFNIAWLCLCCALFLLAAISRCRPRTKLILPAALSAVSLALLLTANAASARLGAGTITVLDVGQGQCISVFAGDKTVVIDCGSINSLDNAGETAGSYLLTNGRRRVDALLLTHLHSDHAGGVPRLLELVDVGEIIIPSGIDDEDGILSSIASAAEAHGTAIRRVSSDEALSYGGILLSLYAPADTGDVNERCMAMRVSIGSYDMLVTGDSPARIEGALAENHDLSGTELLIVGHHGSRYSSSRELLSALGADTAVISVGYNTYGHPTHEALARLAEYGYNIYRTDLNGNVIIRIPAE